MSVDHSRDVPWNVPTVLYATSLIDFVDGDVVDQSQKRCKGMKKSTSVFQASLFQEVPITVRTYATSLTDN